MEGPAVVAAISLLVCMVSPSASGQASHPPCCEVSSRCWTDLFERFTIIHAVPDLAFDCPVVFTLCYMI